MYLLASIPCMIDCFLGCIFGVLSYLFWARLQIYTLYTYALNCVVNGESSFLTGSVFECDIAHRWPVAVFCMLYKFRCYPMHRMCQCGLHAVILSHIGTLMRLLAAEPRRQYHRTFIRLSVSLWNDLGDPVFDGVGLARFKSRANACW